MKSRYTHDYLQKTSKWDEQDEMETHYAAHSVKIGSLAGKDLEQEADAMAAKLTISRTEMEMAAKMKQGDKPVVGGLLPLYVRKKMERLFHADFSDVRIYTDSSAAKQNDTFGANAFTIGNNIYFSKGAYNPYTLEGQQLLVHELAHILQQRRRPAQVMAQTKKEQLIKFTLEFTQDIQAGDPQKIALVIFIQRLLNIDAASAKKLSRDYHWDGDFPEVKLNGSKSVIVEAYISETTYNNLLTSVYGKDNPVVKGYNKEKNLHQKNFDNEDKLRTLAKAAELRSKLSPEEEELFKKAAIEKNGATPEELLRSLRYFKAHIAEYRKKYGPTDKVKEKVWQAYQDNRKHYNIDKPVGSVPKPAPKKNDGTPPSLKESMQQYQDNSLESKLTPYEKDLLDDAAKADMDNPGYYNQVRKMLEMNHPPASDTTGFNKGFNKGFHVGGGISGLASNDYLITLTLGPYENVYAESGIEELRSYLESRLDKEAFELMEMGLRNQMAAKGSVNTDILGFEQIAAKSRQDAVTLKIIPQQLVVAWSEAAGSVETLRQQLQGVPAAKANPAAIIRFYKELEAATAMYHYTEKHVIEHGMSYTETTYTYKTPVIKAHRQYLSQLQAINNAAAKTVITDFSEAVAMMDNYIKDRLNAVINGKGSNENAAREIYNRLDATGPMVRHLDDLKAKHPDAYKVNAFFIEEQEGLDQYRAIDTETEGKASPLQMYLYKDKGEWVLADLSNPFDDEPKENRVAQNESLSALFNMLDSNKRFPRGFISWSVPVLGENGRVRTHAERTLSDWLKLGGMVLGGILLAVGTMGASIPFEAVALSSGLIIAGSVVSMKELHDQNMLTPKAATIEVATIIGALMPGVSVAMEKFVASAALEVGTYARLAVLADSYYVRIAPSVIGMAADSVVLITLAADAKEQLAQIEKMPDGSEKEFARKRVYTSLFITGAISIIGYHANVKGIKSMKDYTGNLALEEIQLGGKGNKTTEVIAFPVKMREGMAEGIKTAYSQNEMAHMFFYGRKLNIPETEIEAFLSVARSKNAVLWQDITAMAYNAARKGTANAGSMWKEMEASGILQSAGLNSEKILILQEAFSKTGANGGKNINTQAEIEECIRNGKWSRVQTLLKRKVEIGANWLADYPNIRSSLSEVDAILKSAGFDRYRFEHLLRQSGNLGYLEENANLLSELANKVKLKMQYSDADLLKIFKDAVNTDFVKATLPTDFVNTLNTFGKTDEAIVTYFRNYHNVYTKGDFFTRIEDFLAKDNIYNLTRDEAYALWGYTTNFFYRDLNVMLREGGNIGKVGPIADLMRQGMQKMPKYNGTAFRALEFKGQPLDDFLSKYGTKGSEVTFDDFLSCGSTQEAAFFNKASKNVRIVMEVKDAPVISSVADGIKFRGYAPEELLLNTGARFKVEDIYQEGGVYFIKMKQL